MKEKTNPKGITLIALVITIIVLLILAGVSVTDVRAKGFSVGKKLLNKTNLQKSLDNIVGERKTQVNGEGILNVFFTDSERTYYVTAEGEVLENLNEINQSNIYTYTQDGYITGIKKEYFKKEGEYANKVKYASTGEIKIADAAYFLIDRLNETLVIPSKIEDTKIIGVADRAFGNINNLKQVIISEGIVDIKDDAFFGCGELNYVLLPNSLQNIGDMVFWGCDNLNNITIPENVKSIEDSTFSNCDNLETIIIKVKKGIISGEPWGASDKTQIIYRDAYTIFAEDYVSNKGKEELEELVVKTMLYPGTFDEMLKNQGKTRDDAEKEAEENGMTYEEYLKKVLVESPLSWIAVEYYSKANGWDKKSVTELEQLFLETTGFSMDEFFVNTNTNEEELLKKYSEKEILKYLLNMAFSKFG